MKRTSVGSDLENKIKNNGRLNMTDLKQNGFNVFSRRRRSINGVYIFDPFGGKYLSFFTNLKTIF